MKHGGFDPTRLHSCSPGIQFATPRTGTWGCCSSSITLSNLNPARKYLVKRIKGLIEVRGLYHYHFTLNFTSLGKKKKRQTLTISQRCCSCSHYLWIFPLCCGINQEIYAKLDLFPTLFMSGSFPFSRTVVINYVPTGNPALPGHRRISVLKYDEMLEDVIRL